MGEALGPGRHMDRVATSTALPSILLPVTLRCPVEGFTPPSPRVWIVRRVLQPFYDMASQHMTTAAAEYLQLVAKGTLFNYPPLFTPCRPSSHVLSYRKARLTCIDTHITHIFPHR